jgi:two-component system, NtrC family, response regulator AtoC
MVGRAGELTEQTLGEKLARGPIVSLLLFHREGAVTARLSQGVPLTVGRDEVADVVVDDASLSRVHARFTLRADGIVAVDDLGSSHGTWLAGKRVTQAELSPGAELTLGRVIASLHLLAASDAGPAALESHEGLRLLLDHELSRAEFFRRPVSYALVRPLRGEEVPLRRWSHLFQKRLRSVDRVGMYARDTLELVLPELDAAATAQAVRRASEGLPPLVCGVASFPALGRSAAELVDVAHDALLRAGPDALIELAPERSARVEQDTLDSERPVAVSAAMRKLLATVDRVAQSDINVLLVGETGSGKEVVAKHLHRNSARKDHPMVSVNCGAIANDLVESTLFGHERGAFTGAVTQHAGVFESARGGVVFLDEVGELPLAAQAALLRVLETKRVSRVGSNKEIEVDARVLFATHRDLQQLVESGRFREDLFYRVNAITLPVPALRDRVADIAPLAEVFLRCTRAAPGRRLAFDADVLALLEQHRWPGNVRELRNAIDRAAVLAEDEVVRVEDLPMELSAAGSPASASGVHEITLGPQDDFRATMDNLEAQVVGDALLRANWNQRVAARQLGLPLRTLVYKIRRLRIRRPDPRS